MSNVCLICEGTRMMRRIIAVFLLGLSPLLSKDRAEIAQVFEQNQLFGEAKLKDDKHTCNDLMIYQYGLIPGQKTWIENYVNIASGQNSFSKVLNLAPVFFMLQRAGTIYQPSAFFNKICGFVKEFFL